jgi:hypothetical protein
MRMKYKPGQVIARLYCEACNEERYVIVQARETWRCEGFLLREYCYGGQGGRALIPCCKCGANLCGDSENGTLFEFDEECEGRG